MARQNLLDMLIEREWQYKEGNKVYCPTCGIEFRETTIRMVHRKGCRYHELMKALGVNRKIPMSQTRLPNVPEEFLVIGE